MKPIHLLRRRYLIACCEHYAKALREIKGVEHVSTPSWNIATKALTTSPKKILKFRRRR
jgi:hypothetical protein